VKRPKILILAGGWSREREVSLKSAEGVFQSIPKESYEVSLCDPKENLDLLFSSLKDVDLVINLLHGQKGEDGTMQGLLEILCVRYLGSKVTASALAMDKFISKLIYQNAGLLVPKAIPFFEIEDLNEQIPIEELGFPLIVKPINEGSSVGVRLCEDSSSAFKALREGLSMGMKMLVEEYIQGRELTCCVMGNKTLMALPIIEIRPLYSKIFDYPSKYEPGKTLEICPAELDEKVAEKVREIAFKSHKALGLRHWSRTDMILKDDRVYVLETNTLPGMTPNSLFPLAAKAMGWDMTQLVLKLIELAFED